MPVVWSMRSERRVGIDANNIGRVEKRSKEEKDKKNEKVKNLNLLKPERCEVFLAVSKGRLALS